MSFGKSVFRIPHPVFRISGNVQPCRTIRNTQYTIRRNLLRAVASLYSSSPAVGDTHRVLLIRPDHLGDVLFLTPALRRLRDARPDLHITVLAGPWSEPLLAHNPDIDALETLDFPWFDRKARRSLFDPYRRLFAAAEWLRGRFDTAVILRFDHWWAGWMAAHAGIPRRIGYATPQLAPFLTESVPYTRDRHEALQNLRLVARLGAPATMTPEESPLVLPLPDAAYEKAAALPVPAGAGPLVAIHPGSGAAVKRWRAESWGALANALNERAGARFIITGGPGEVALATDVSAHMRAPATVVAGETSLLEVAALFERCALVAGPDCGPLHLAVAVGTPTVHLYGPVDPAAFGPWGPASRHRVLTRNLDCQYCERLDWPDELLSDHPCVSGMQVAPVLGAAMRLLANVEWKGGMEERRNE